MIRSDFKPRIRHCQTLREILPERPILSAYLHTHFKVDEVLHYGRQEFPTILPGKLFDIGH